ncbi:MAG: hypothetical protein JWM29_1090 [Solirubrobacterales bacterium]|nr:hypothetical protein [Solirubrobacterales bacterium]
MRLFFDADFRADPLWDIRGNMVGVEQLPISESTRQALRDWARRWDRLAEQDMDAEDIEAGMKIGTSEPVPKEAWNEHEAEGRALWTDLQNELGPDWQVGWLSFPDGVRHVQWTEGALVEPLPFPPRRPR